VCTGARVRRAPFCVRVVALYEPLPGSLAGGSKGFCRATAGPNPAGSTPRQGLTLVRLSAQRKQFLWDRGCI
jgi:hypothetical protein